MFIQKPRQVLPEAVARFTSGMFEFLYLFLDSLKDIFSIQDITVSLWTWWELCRISVWTLWSWLLYSPDPVTSVPVQEHSGVIPNPVVPVYIPQGLPRRRGELASTGEARSLVGHDEDFGTGLRVMIWMRKGPGYAESWATESMNSNDSLREWIDHVLALSAVKAWGLP
jgi:hypothetical protein